VGKSLFDIGANIFATPIGEEKRETKSKSEPNSMKSSSKSKLSEIIDSSTTKDSLKDILQALKLEISGNKEELVSRLLTYTKELPRETFILLDLRTLQYIASKNNIPSRRSKEDQVNELLLGLFNIPIPPKKDSPEIKSELDQKFEALDDKGKQLYDIVDITDKSSIQAALEKVGKPVSGSKNELIIRLLEALNLSPERVLESLDGPSLWEIADNNNVKRRKLKQDQIDEILKGVFNITRQFQSQSVNLNSQNESFVEVNKPELQAIKTDQGDFDVLMKEIRSWAPHSRYRSEGEYRIDLYSYLNAKGYKTRMEEGDTLADILVNDKIPIEVKKSPRSTEYDRAKGQLHKHCKAFNSVIAVVCDVKNRDEFEDFKTDLSDILHKYRFEVIEK
jgi:hypothetical protein